MMSFKQLRDEKPEPVEIKESFDVPAIDYNKLKDYKGFQGINIKKMIKANDFSKFNVKTVQDIIVWLNMVAMQWKADNLKEEVELEEAVSVDMRTRGYKQAIKRGLIRAEKTIAKGKAKKKIEDDAEATIEDIANSTGAAIAGRNVPLGKKLHKRKSFKESIITNEAKKITAATLKKVFNNTADWGSEMKDQTKVVKGNLEIIDTSYHDNDRNLKNMVNMWTKSGGTYYEYFKAEYGATLSLVSKDIDTKPSGWKKKAFDGDIVLSIVIKVK